MIVITGASDGLGLQLAKVFQDSGKNVVNISRRPSEYADMNITTDLLDAAAIKVAADKILETDEVIEVLINCAGVLSIEKLDAISPNELDRIFGVNVKAPMLLISALIKKLKTDKTDIVNVASTVGLKAYANQAAYGSSKWAIRGFSQNLQLELKDTNRVISLCVGGFGSEFASKVTGQPIADPENWMDPRDIAVFVAKIIELPKSMEVSEIVINRRNA
jgi:NADP-dependent 3-hydroxy acid dehydrogenase YdfG